MKPLSIYLILLEHEHAVSTGENWRKQIGHCWQEPLMATFRQHQLFLCLQLPWRSSPGGDTVGICLSIADVNVKEADLGNGDIHQPSKIWNHECGYITFIVLVGWIILGGAELCVPRSLRTASGSVYVFAGTKTANLRQGWLKWYMLLNAIFVCVHVFFFGGGCFIWRYLMLWYWTTITIIVIIPSMNQ